MTVDRTKVEVGDVVTVRAVVAQIDSNDADNPFCVEVSCADGVWVNIADVVAHELRLSPGQIVWGLATKCGGMVKHVIDDLAWVVFDDGRHEVVFFDQVERVPTAKEAATQ